MPSEDLRITALEQAVSLYKTCQPPPFWAADDLTCAVLRTADKFLYWLRAGGSVTRVPLYVYGPVDEDDGNSPYDLEGPFTMAGMNTGQKMYVLADPEDAAGYDVDVPVVFGITDDNVASLVSDPDNAKAMWVVSGAPGSTVLTATVTKLDGTELTGTLAIDVVPADVAVINIEAGAPVPE